MATEQKDLTEIFKIMSLILKSYTLHRLSACPCIKDRAVLIPNYLQIRSLAF